MANKVTSSVKNSKKSKGDFKKSAHAKTEYQQQRDVQQRKRKKCGDPSIC